MLSDLIFKRRRFNVNFVPKNDSQTEEAPGENPQTPFLSDDKLWVSLVYLVKFLDRFVQDLQLILEDLLPGPD
jgi:hypothetical protein